MVYGVVCWDIAQKLKTEVAKFELEFNVFGKTQYFSIFFYNSWKWTIRRANFKLDEPKSECFFLIFQGTRTFTMFAVELISPIIFEIPWSDETFEHFSRSSPGWYPYYFQRKS